MTQLSTILLLISFDVATSQSEKTLELVQVVFRHGHRTPSQLIPSDEKNAAETWYPGVGELTKQGMRQQYELGKLMAKQYMDQFQLMNPNEAFYQIYVHSSDFNRTIASALCNMAGFFSSSSLRTPTFPGWPVNWSPVPVHTVKLIDDSTMWTFSPCPVAEAVVENEVKKSPEYTKIEKENQELFEWLSNKTGKTVNLNNVWTIDDPLMIIYEGSPEDWNQSDHPLPEWVTEEVYKKVRRLHQASNAFLFNHEKVKRLRGGLLIGEIINRMRQKQASLSGRNLRALSWIKNLKYFVYSGHDLNILVLLQILGVINGTAPVEMPGYASCLTFELWRNENGTFEVKVYLRDGPNSTVFKPLQISGCPELPSGCELSTFESRSSKYLVHDWKAECTEGSGSPFRSSSILVWAIAFVAMDFRKGNSAMKVNRQCNRRWPRVISRIRNLYCLLATQIAEQADRRRFRKFVANTAYYTNSGTKRYLSTRTKHQNCSLCDARMNRLKAFLLLITFHVATPQSEKTLELVQVVLRHGHRTPIMLIPTDEKNSIETWYPGLGELTKRGMRQQYELGKLLANQYIEQHQLVKLNDAFSQIYVRSTDYNRTITSALANMAGFLSSSNPRTPTFHGWPLNWSPVPVHTVKLTDDSTLWTYARCPVAEATKLNEIEMSPAYLKVQNENEKMFEWLSNKTGKMINISNVWTIDDSLMIIYEGSPEDWKPNEHPLPEWVTDEVYKKIHYLREAADAFIFNHEKVRRLRGGLLIGEIINRMRQKQASLSGRNLRALSWIKNLKYFVYSGHDLNILVLLQILGVINGTAPVEMPGYASCLTFELWRNENGTFEVKVYLRDGPNSTVFKSLQISGCPELPSGCELSTFESRSSKYLVHDWKAECTEGSSSSFRSSSILAWTIAFLAWIVGVSS
uniref:acid phosphatase n=1 Tax=Trichuris muris TaxID=70415 RepID=A0A5S6R2G6_TRIMR